MTAALLRVIWTRFSDDDSKREPFRGYTDGRRWNGFECPHLPLAELVRVLDTLVEWGDEQSYEVIDDQNVRVRGVAEGEEYVLSAKLQPTAQGDLWLFDCGGAWTFVEAPTSPPQSDIDSPPLPCEHPEHRLGTHGRLRKHQRVCMNCGETVLRKS